MLISILKKTAYTLLWLGLISILAFWLSKQVPGDEILDYLSIEQEAFNTSVNADQQRQAYINVAKKRGLDQPLFYFSVHSAAYPDTLYRIIPKEDQLAIRHWIDQSGQRETAMQLFSKARGALQYTCRLSANSVTADEACKTLHTLLISSHVNDVQHYAIALENSLLRDSMQDSWLLSEVKVMKSLAAKLMIRKTKPLRDFLPSFRWNGTHNQYHHWISTLVLFQPWPSLMDGRNAWTKIQEALKWTLLLNGLAVFFALWLGIVIGIWSGQHAGKLRERILSVFLFAIFAVPAFWLATLLILFFSSGEWLSILPSGGLGPYHAAHSFFSKSIILAEHLLLPVFCLAVGSLAYISRQMKQSVQHELKQPYVHALRTLGVSEKTILRKHVIRNALFPIITLFGKALPEILSGSLIIEVIFSIPGMGRLLYTSILARDWPVVFPILMLAATVTIICYVLTDVVYQWLDPRVKSKI